MNKTRLMLLVAAIAAIGASIGIGTSLGGVASGHPITNTVSGDAPRPPWVDSKGGVDMSKVPAWMPVWEGETIVGYVRGTDSFSTDGRPIPLFDRPGGRQIGRADEG